MHVLKHKYICLFGCDLQLSRWGWQRRRERKIFAFSKRLLRLSFLLRRWQTPLSETRFFFSHGKEVSCWAFEQLSLPGPREGDESLAVVRHRAPGGSRWGRRWRLSWEEKEAAGEEGAWHRGTAIPAPVWGLTLQVVLEWKTENWFFWRFINQLQPSNGIAWSELPTGTLLAKRSNIRFVHKSSRTLATDGESVKSFPPVRFPNF